MLLVSLALSVPKFLETKFLWTQVNSSLDNETDVLVTMLKTFFFLFR